MEQQLDLFGNEQIERPKPKRPTGGSSNPIVFHDYESYVAKFTENPKTTDDTFTPRDVYEAVLKYVGEVVDLTGKQILRPFYPGGDYRNAEYPEDGIVIDNPPFSIFTEIVKFYTATGIPVLPLRTGQDDHVLREVLHGGHRHRPADLRERRTYLHELCQQPIRRHHHHDGTEVERPHILVPVAERESEFGAIQLPS